MELRREQWCVSTLAVAVNFTQMAVCGEDQNTSEMCTPSHTFFTTLENDSCCFKNVNPLRTIIIVRV